MKRLPRTRILSSLALALLMPFCTGINAQPVEITAEEAFSPEWRLFHYSPDDYPIGYQNWSVTEDAAGRIYVSDQNGIRHFNGEQWDLIKTPTETTVRSLASYEGHRIFYGAQGDIGVVELTSTGQLVATTIADSITESLELGNVWGTHVVGDKVFFQASKAIIVLENGSFKVFTSRAGYHNAFEIQDRYFVRAFGEGLLEWKDDNFVPVKNAELLADEKVFLISEDRDRSSLIVWTQDSGQFRLGGDSLSHFRKYPDKLRDIASESRLYYGIQTPKNGYLIATLGSGLLHVDSSGSLIQQYSTENGFPDDTINYLYTSASGDIWVALHNVGLAQIDHRTRLLRLGRNQGLRGHINSVKSFRASVGIVTATGFFSLDGSRFKVIPSYPSSLFNLLPGTSQAWDFQDLDSTLIVASEESVAAYTYDADGHINTTPTVCRLYNNNIDEGPVGHGYFIEDISGNGEYFVGLETGAARLRVSPTGECVLDLIKGTGSLEVRTIARDEHGLWLGTRYQGVHRVSPLGVREYPFGSRSVSVVKIDDHVVFYGGAEVPMIYDAKVDSLVKSPIFAPLMNGGDDQIQYIYDDRRGGIWVSLKDRIVKIHENEDGDYEIKSPAALSFPRSAVTSMHIDDGGVLWLNDGDELVRYDAYSTFNDYQQPKVFITSIIAASSKKELFNGFHTNGRREIVEQQIHIPDWEYEDRNLIVDASAIDVSNGDRLSYQYYSITHQAWSEWQSSSDMILSDLKEGRHTIRVRVKDSIGRISNEARFSFVLLPPWYRTWWAILTYTLFGGLFILTSIKFVRMRHAHIKAEEQAKELERERVIVRKLQQANDRLQEANKLKDEFLATTSHELRTPLTAILGFTSVLKEEVPASANYREFLDIIEDSGSRLMDTLNSLLDIAKLRAGTMSLDVAPLNLYDSVCETLNSLSERAEKKGIFLRVKQPEMVVYAAADHYALSRIMHNLVSNAIKFTESGGVTVNILLEPEGPCVEVVDTGIGIDEEFVPKLFSEFVQESDGLARAYEGSGLGLAISGRLAFLMGGEISVESKKGQGSTFKLSLLSVGERSQRSIPVSSSQLSSSDSA